MTKYYLGIDWGEKKSGLAIADNEVRIASPLEEVETRDLVKTIEGLNEGYSFSKVILGSISQGKINSNKNKTKSLKEALEKKGFDVASEEESFSTRLAQQNLSETQEKGISKKDNAESARIILQSWIDN